MSNVYHSLPDQNAGAQEAKRQITKMKLVFRMGEVQLSTTEAEVLKKWVVTWVIKHKHNMVAMSGAYETSRAGRLRRVLYLVQVLAQLGVTAKSICQDEEWAKPARMGLMDDLPTDVVWLELVESRGGKRTSWCQAPIH